MLSVALARAAAEAGHKVLFTTCEDLVRRLRRAIAEHRFPSGLRFYTTPRLLVIDELGYRILDEESRSLLFEVINARYLMRAHQQRADTLRKAAAGTAR